MADHENDTSVRQRKSGSVKEKDRTQKSNQISKSSQENTRSLTYWLTLGISIIAIVAIVGELLVLLPSNFEPVAFYWDDPPAWEGPLEVNTKLQRAEHVYVNQLEGPESLAHQDGVIYTGTHDGKIVRLENDGSVAVVATLGKPPPCGSYEDEPTCGRPLGMRFDKAGQLVVADAYLGLYRVDVKTGEATLLVSPDTPVEGQPPMKFLNDLDIDDGGVVYFTDSSSKWERRNGRTIVLESGNHGRLFSHNLKTGENKLLLDGLVFINGVQLSPKQDFLLLTETGRAKILKYYLKGSKKGQVEIFADNVPGTPDNIRACSTGGYWVPLAGIRNPQGFSFFDFVGPRPWLRTILYKIFGENIIKQFTPRHGLILKFNENGEIVESLHDPGAKVIPNSSEVLEMNGTLYFGSFFAPFLGKLSLDQI